MSFATLSHHARSPLLIICLTLFGVCLSLGVYQLWLAGGRRYRRMHLWIAGWCALSSAAIFYKFIQFSSSSPIEAVISIRMYVGLYAWMPLFLSGSLHAISGTRPTALVRSVFWLLGGVTALLLGFTDLIFTQRHSIGTHIYDHKYHWASSGPLFAPLLLTIVLVCIGYAFFTVWRMKSVDRAFRRVLFCVIGLFGLLALHGILAGLGLQPFSLFDLSFPAVSLGFTYVSVLRYRRLQDQLESLVTEQTQELERKNRSLDIALQEAQAATRAKSRFLANMSHELRTPMNGVLGMTELLYDSDLGEEERQLLEAIQHSGETLLALLNDILDLSKIEAGQMTLQEQPFSLAKVMRDTVRLLGVSATQKGLGLEWTIDRGLKVPLRGDAFRLQQVLLNLTSNAIKFTSAGKVELKATMARREGDMAYVQIAVSDTGSGIPPDEQSRIFESFTQTEDAQERAADGVGLGLAISRELITLMGGEISVSSELMRGSTFTVIVPLAFAPEAKLPRQQRLITEELSFQVHILVVEDNPINQRVTQLMLKKLGCSFKLATNGQEALELLKRENFSLVLMDCLMPVMDGYEAATAIRAQEAAAGSHPIPIIAMTANVLEGDRERCLAAGMNDYIAKPMTMKQLRATIKRWSPSARADESPDPQEKDREPATEP